MHVDGAYGGAGLAAPSARPSFNGIERADSFIVDPHKWLFAPLTAVHCCTEIQSTRAPPTGSMANTWRCSMTASGIPLITPITYPAEREAYPLVQPCNARDESLQRRR